MTQPELVILAAGMGSRYGGLKQLDGVGPAGETLLDYAVYDAQRAGFGAVIFVIRRDFEADFLKKVVRRYESRMEIRLAFQNLEDLPAPHRAPAGREKPWGTAHAVRAARTAVQAPFAAINADDFYGAGAYRAMAAHLSAAAPGEFAMAAYRLRDTLSPHGTVSRGICQVAEDGWLESVVEHTALREEGGKVASASGSIFNGSEPVSVNFWGFTPLVFPLLEKYLAESFAEEGASLKSEFYIPEAVRRMVNAGEARVRVLSPDSTWFGITYREDRPAVAATLAEMTSRGDYPQPLWKL